MEKKRSNLITVGRITGVFGIKGWVKLKSFTQPEDSILSYQPWWLKTRHGVKPVELAESQKHGDGWIIRLSGIEDRAAAEGFARCEVAVEKSVLPDLDEDDFYWHQLIGMQVVSVFGDREMNFGIIEKMLETGANDVMVVKPSEVSIDDRERLIPYVLGMYVKDVSLASGVVQVDWDPDF